MKKYNHNRKRPRHTIKRTGPKPSIGPQAEKSEKSSGWLTEIGLATFRQFTNPRGRLRWLVEDFVHYGSNDAPERIKEKSAETWARELAMFVLGSEGGGRMVEQEDHAPTCASRTGWKFELGSPNTDAWRRTLSREKLQVLRGKDCDCGSAAIPPRSFSLAWLRALSPRTLKDTAGDVRRGIDALLSVPPRPWREKIDRPVTRTIYLREDLRDRLRGEGPRLRRKPKRTNEPADNVNTHWQGRRPPRGFNHIFVLMAQDAILQAPDRLARCPFEGCSRDFVRDDLRKRYCSGLHQKADTMRRIRAKSREGIDEGAAAADRAINPRSGVITIAETQMRPSG